MANFPTNPSIGDLFETKYDTFKWNGSGWEALGRILTHRTPPTTALSSLSIKESGGSLDEADEDTVLLIAETDFTGVLKTAHSNDASTTLLLQENVDPGFSEFVSDANTKLLIGETIESGLSASTADAATSLLINSSYDSSNSNHPVTISGDSELVKGYSLDGSGDYLSAADHADWNLGSGDFTIEFWAYWNSLSGGSGFMGQTHGGSAEQGWYFYRHNSGIIDDGFIFRWRNTAGARVGYEWSEAELGLVTDVWYHVALVRNGTSLKLYLDGKEKAIRVTEVAIGSTTLRDADGVLTIGQDANGFQHNGYMDGIRVSNTARYTADFTAEITAIDANHKLVLDGKATDSSASAHAITFNGNAHEVSKLGETSWKLDGTGDYLALPSNFTSPSGAGDWTVETWFNCSDLSGYNALFGRGTGDSNEDIVALVKSSEVYLDWGGGSQYKQFTASLSNNTWYHIAFVKIQSPYSFTIYLDGVALSQFNQGGSGGTVGTIASNHTNFTGTTTT